MDNQPPETPEDKQVKSFVTANAKNATNSSNTVRMQKPKKKTRRKPKPVYIIATQQAEQVSSGFVDFLRKNGVVALSVGFVIATQVQVLSKQLITSFIDPLFTLFFGSAIGARSTSITFHGNSATFTLGAFVYSLINFLFIVLVLYIIIKVFKLDKLDKPKEEDKPKDKK